MIVTGANYLVWPLWAYATSVIVLCLHHNQLRPPYNFPPTESFGKLARFTWPLFFTPMEDVELTGNRYRSLRANLGHCSDLGRLAFREAESKMNRLTLAAQAMCR